VTPPYNTLPYTTLAGGSSNGCSRVLPDGIKIRRHPMRARKSSRVVPISSRVFGFKVSLTCFLRSPLIPTINVVGVDFIQRIQVLASSRSTQTQHSGSFNSTESMALYNAKAVASLIQLVALEACIPSGWPMESQRRSDSRRHTETRPAKSSNAVIIVAEALLLLLLLLLLLSSLGMITDSLSMLLTANAWRGHDVAVAVVADFLAKFVPNENAAVECDCD
jgi:hypothetical protein